MEGREECDGQDVLDAAKEGCKQVYAILKDLVLENAKKLYQSTQQ